MMRRHVQAGTLLLLAALLVAGCGGGNMDAAKTEMQDVRTTMDGKLDALEELVAQAEDAKGMDAKLEKLRDRIVDWQKDYKSYELDAQNRLKGLKNEMSESNQAAMDEMMKENFDATRNRMNDLMSRWKEVRPEGMGGGGDKRMMGDKERGDADRKGGRSGKSMDHGEKRPAKKKGDKPTGM